MKRRVFILMTDIKKKNALNAANTESEKGIIPKVQVTAHSNANDNIINNLEQGYIQSILPYGEENAISTNDLLRITGIRDSRALKSIISEERKKGACILSKTSGGYFLPSDGEKGKQERLKYVATIKAKSLHTMEAAKPAINELQILEGQQSFEGF